MRLGYLSVLKAYYDGSNKSDSPDCRVLTLAGFAGTDPIWNRIDRQWGAVLDRHGVKFMHMKDAIALQEEFRGWDYPRVRLMILDLLKSLGPFNQSPIKGVVCTVMMDGFRSAKRKYPMLPRPEFICTVSCLTLSWLWYSNIPRRSVELEAKCGDLFFDRNENFLGHATDIWNHKNLKNRPAFRAIRTTAPADMRDFPGLQMADMLAWAYSRPHGRGGYEDICEAIRKAIPVWHQDFASEQFADINEVGLENVLELKFPPRKGDIVKS